MTYVSLNTINVAFVVLAINNKISNTFGNCNIARRNEANKQQIKEFAALDIVQMEKVNKKEKT